MENISKFHCRPNWSKPTPQCIKINTNAEVRLEGSLVGVVARDQQGKILKIKVAHCHSDIPKVVEAFGVLQGLILTKNEGRRQIRSESDAQTLVLSLNDPKAPPSQWATTGYVYDILVLKKEFQEIHFSWIPREENFLAYYISCWCIQNNASGYISQSSFPRNFDDFLTQEEIGE